MSEPPSRRSTRFSMRSKQLGQLLQESGEAKAEHIAKALKIQEQQGGLIGQILQHMNVCNQQAVANALLKQVQVTDVQCDDLTPAPEVLSLVKREQCETDKLCPFELLGKLLCVAMGNPLNRRAINAIEETTHLKVKPFKAPWPRIKEMIERGYPAVGTLAPAAVEESAPAYSLELEAPAEEAPVAVEEPGPESHIEGLDQLNEDQAEVIETDRRGLTRRTKAPVSDDPARPSVSKVAKVNVDLDALDISSTEEVVAGAGRESMEEGLEEIQAGGAEPKAAHPKGRPPKVAVKVEPVATFALVPDAYFYSEDEGPEEGEVRSDELLELLDQLPVAELLAESAADYRMAQQQKAEATRSSAAAAAVPVPAPPVPTPEPAVAAAPKTVAIELEPAPRGPVLAVALSEADFLRISAQLTTDPIGEWDWRYAASGPVSVEIYETENN